MYTLPLTTMAFVEILFYASVAGIVHTYFVFPLVMAFIAVRRRQRKHRQRSTESVVPAVTILIAAYNEQANIRDRIENIALQNYPHEKLRVIVGSDGSTDATNNILSDMVDHYEWLSVELYGENRGKVYVLNDLLQHVQTPIVIYTDADTIFSTDSLLHLVEPFSSPSVGAVAGMRHVLVRGSVTATSEQEESYLSIDNIIREGESALGCVIGAHGSLYAIRTELVEPIPTDIAYTDDFYVSMLPFEKGFEVVQAEGAHSYAETARDTASDFRRKTRYAATIFATCYRFRKQLLSGSFVQSYCFFSHRVSRWFLPFVLLLCLTSAAMLSSSSPLYSWVLFVQVSFYVLALIAILIPRLSRVFSLFSLSAYFVYSNVALFIGFFRWITGRGSNKWTPERS